MTCPHFSELIFTNAQKYANKPALWHRNETAQLWESISWNDLAFQVKCTAQALIEMGVGAQQNIAFFSQNKPELFAVDFAVFVVRAVSIPIYATSSAEQVNYIVNDSSTEIIFVGEQYQYDKACEVMQMSGQLKTIVVFDENVVTNGAANTVFFRDLLKKGEENLSKLDLPAHLAKASADDTATILYTSGTTGEPKGAVLTHANYLEAMRIHNIRLTTMTDRDTSLAFLPITHVFERAWCYLCLFKGVEIYVILRPQEIQRSVKEVQPTLMCAVPRFWEKVYIEVKEHLNRYSPLMQGIIAWSLAVGRKYNLRCLRRERKPFFWLKIRYLLADKLIFSKVKKTLGVENANFFPVAGAALSDEIITFFRSIGIPLMYGYGLTESTATVCCFPYTHYEIGTIGKIMPDIEVKISDDNEILLKGKTIFKGYYNRPEQTREAFTEDGFFRTGDAGALDGCNLIMTERLKDLFKTSNGKYIAPQQIELRLTQDKFVEQAVVIGDGYNYVTALIVPAFERLKEYAAKNSIAFTEMEDLLANPKIVELYENIIKERQQGMASYEQIKKFTLIKKGFSLETGELTNTLKLRRTVIAQKNAIYINRMYNNSTKK